MVLPSYWTVGPGNANETPVAGWELAKGKVEAGLGPGPLHGAGKGGGRNVTTGTWSQRINIDVAEDRTIIGFGGHHRGYRGLWEEESGVSCKWGGGGASSELQAGRHRRGLAAATSALVGPVRICTRKSCRPGSPPRCLPPPPPSARARAQPHWLADTRSRCLSWLAPTLPPPIPRGSRIRKVR